MITSPPVSVDDVCDYIIVKLIEAEEELRTLKLHKLLYYVQAWCLAFYGRRCFTSDFQAWVHGPVNRPIYNRFRDSKSMYSRMRLSDVRPDFDPEAMPQDIRQHIDGVLEVYAEFSDDQLEQMTHQERPWIAARHGYDPRQRCESLISDQVMAEFYAARAAG